MFLKKYWTLFKSNMSASIEYRGALFIWILVEIVGLTSAIFIWMAIFRTNSAVGGYDLSGIISYYLFLPIVGGFTSIFISEHLPRRIKDGEISADLVKPYSIAVANLLNQFAIKVTQLSIKLPLYFFVGLFFYFIFNISFKPQFILLGIFVCLFAYLLHYSIDILVSYIAFWSDDVWYLNHLKFIILTIFGGLSFPLDLLPKKIQIIFNFLPFRFIYYFPVKIMRGDFTGDYFFQEMTKLIIWLLVLLILGNFVWKKGIKKYGAYGN